MERIIRLRSYILGLYESSINGYVGYGNRIGELRISARDEAFRVPGLNSNPSGDICLSYRPGS